MFETDIDQEPLSVVRVVEKSGRGVVRGDRSKNLEILYKCWCIWLKEIDLYMCSPAPPFGSVAVRSCK